MFFNVWFMCTGVQALPICFERECLEIIICSVNRVKIINSYIYISLHIGNVITAQQYHVFFHSR